MKIEKVEQIKSGPFTLEGESPQRELYPISKDNKGYYTLKGDIVVFKVYFDSPFKGSNVASIKDLSDVGIQTLSVDKNSITLCSHLGLVRFSEEFDFTIPIPDVFVSNGKSSSLTLSDPMPSLAVKDESASQVKRKPGRPPKIK